MIRLSNRRAKPVSSTMRSTLFEPTEKPGKLVAGRLGSSPSPDTLLLSPSGISVSGIESWARKLAEVA